MSNTPSLLPCPFCGAPAHGYAIAPHSHSPAVLRLIPELPDHPGSYVIEGQCPCGSGLIGANESEVTARWNRRTPQQEAQEPVAWQPIETAPTGKIVLVHYKNSLGNGRTMRARYYLPETLESETEESGWADEGWYEESEAYEYLMPLDEKPTHWMPLPPAPDGEAPQPAPAPLSDDVVRDAALWHWLAEYLVGTRTDLDDEIVASKTVNDLRKLVEAATQQAGEMEVFCLQWPGEDRINLSTVFDTEAEALDYMQNRCDTPGIRLVRFSSKAPTAQGGKDA